MTTLAPASFVDADGHVLEHPDRMLEYAPTEYRDRIWHVETDASGKDWVVFDGHRSPANTFAYAGCGGMPPEVQARAAAGEIRYADIRPGAFEPVQRLADLDAERIDQTVLYPTNLLGIAGVADVDFAVAQCRAYNDWLSDFCSTAPDRLFGIAIIPQQDPDEAAAEIKRAHALPNLVGTLIRPNPVVEWKHFLDPVWDPIWRAASDAGWPLGLHPYLAGDVPGAVIGLRLNTIKSRTAPFEIQGQLNMQNIFWTQCIGNPVDMMTSLAFVLAGGVCERFPDLTFIVLETNGGWITPWMERLDHHYKSFAFDVPDISMAPSEYFRRQCYISFDADEETMGLAAESEFVGAERIIWASDYPHPDAKFPGTVDELLTNIADLDAGSQRAIACDNARRLYSLPDTGRVSRI